MGFCEDASFCAQSHSAFPPPPLDVWPHWPQSSTLSSPFGPVLARWARTLPFFHSTL